MAADKPAVPGDAGSPERERTDTSLRSERAKADLAIAKKKHDLEEDADAVVRVARATADAVLKEARDLADERIEDPGTGPETGGELASERRLEDRVLREERAVADDSLRAERAASALILARHLPFERDATDKHLLIERIRSDDSLAKRDDFLAMVCHDLRDLLNGIVMSSSVLSAGAAADRVQTETGRIQRYAGRMNRLIADLVDVASIDAGKLAVSPSQADAGALAEEACEGLRSTAAAKGLTLVVNRPAAPVVGFFDGGRVLQVLANLIVNAVKFTPEGGTITVECKAEGDAVWFYVGDTGQGIPADMLEAIFERFWQVGRDDRRGLGLGLYISRCIVEAHGGTITAQSAPRQGSRFAFSLPQGSAL